MARPRKPVELKKQQGTFRKDRNPSDPILLDPAKIQPPYWLDEIAIDEWNRLLPKLYENKLISEPDMATFASYCHSYSMLVHAEKDIQENGLFCESEKGGKYQNPAVGIANTSKKMINSFAGKFGLSPSDRAKIDIPKKDDEPESPMLKLLGGNKNA